MECYKFKERRIIARPHGLTISNEEHKDGKFIEGNTNNNIHDDGNSNTQIRDGSLFSSLSREEKEKLRVSKESVVSGREVGGYYHQFRRKATETSSLAPLKPTEDGRRPHKEIQNKDTIKLMSSALKQTTYEMQRVAVTGKHIKDSQISIFKAEKYFKTEKEKNTGENEPIPKVWNLTENSESKMQTKTKVLFTPKLPCHSSHHRVSFPLPSVVSVCRGFKAPESTSTASSEASWESHSRLFPQFTSTFPGSEQKKSTSSRWRTGTLWCPCSRSEKKAVEINNSLIRVPSVSDSLSSSAAVADNPLSSFTYTYSGLGKRVLTRCIEKQRLEASFEDNASEIGNINSRSIKGHLGGDAKSLRNCPDSISYMRNSHKERFGDKVKLHQRKIVANDDRLSFPVLQAFPEENLEVFEINHSSAKTQESFTLNSYTSKFINDYNSRIVEDGDQDKESDSSSDLFEIESLTTEGTCFPDSCEMRLKNSLNFCGIEEAVMPSRQSSYYEPSEASLDWSVTTGDTIDNASLKVFSSDFEQTRMRKRRPLKGEFSGLRKAFLGCRNWKALSVVASAHVSNMNKYD